MELQSDEEEFQAAGLYDPTAPNAADRLALLRYLSGLGIPIDRMVEANAVGRLAGLAAEFVLRPEGEQLSLLDMSERTGLPVELLDDVRRAAGLPVVPDDAPAFSEFEVKTFESFARAASLFGVEPLLQYVRVLGSSMARLAEAAIEMFLVNIAAPLTDQGELALAKANLEAAGALKDVPHVMDSLFRVHLAEAVRRFDATRADSSSYDLASMAVGFVDLVGFTPLSTQLSPRELAQVIDDFEARAYYLVAAHDGRVVKLVGDEVMFVTRQAGGACEVALSLMESFEPTNSIVKPRGGLAFGELLARGGDYFGPTVNMASRIADLAVPHEVLTTMEVCKRATSEAGERFRFDPAGRRQLKGFGEPVELMSISRA